MFNFDAVQACLVIMIIFVIGEYVSSKTKAMVSSLFIQAVLFLICFWTKLIPTDIVATSGYTSIGVTAMLMIVVNMGTTINIKELIENWKVVAIALASIAGMALLLFTIGRMFFAQDAIITAIPPLAGGATASLIMQQAAAALGRNDLSVLAATVLCTQGFIGYPIATIFLKKEAKRLLADYPAQKDAYLASKSGSGSTATENGNTSWRTKMANRPRSMYVSLLELYAVVWVSSRLQMLTGISQYVYCLVLGVVLHEFGIIGKNGLGNGQAFGLCVASSMAMVMMGLAGATPEMLGGMLLMLLGIFIIGIGGMLIAGAALGKVLHYSIPMSCGIALNCLFGFPPNMIITTDAVNGTTEDEQERAYLMDQILPKMLIGGFTSVTIASTLIAGMLVGFLH